MDFLTFCTILAGYLAIIVVAGILADYVLPHIGPLMSFIDRLPIMEDLEHTSTEETPTEGTTEADRAA